MMKNEKDEHIVGERANVTGVDIDGVLGRLQPTGEDKEK